MTAEFWITSFVVTATPGTGALFTLAAGLSRGRRASAVAAVGCTLGIVPHVAAAISGAALLVATSPTAFAILKWSGVAYLLWMAWATLGSKGALDVDINASPRSSLRTVLTAIGVNLLNPKLTLFFFAFLPQFVPVGDGAVVQMLLLSAAFMALTLVIFLGYGFAAASVRDKIVSRPRVMDWIRRVLALSFVALSARLAFAAA